MNPELTPEQRQQMSSWAAQRDAILSEISVHRTANDQLTSSNKALAASNTEIDTKIKEKTGRLEELDKKEKEAEGILSVEVADLTALKSKLQAEVFGLEKEVQALKANVESHKGMITTLADTHNKVFDHTADLHKAMGDSTKLNAANIAQINELLDRMKGSLQQVWDVNSQNVEKANYIIAQLPQMFFELQKIHLNRKRL